MTGIEIIQKIQEDSKNKPFSYVTGAFGDTDWAADCQRRQEYLLSLPPVIDTPLRVGLTNPRVTSGEIFVTRRADAVGGGTLVSLHDPSVFLGNCRDCPDQCGVADAPRQNRRAMNDQTYLFPASDVSSDDGCYPPPEGRVQIRSSR